MTNSSAKPYTASDHPTGPRVLHAGAIHLWQCQRDAVVDSEFFCRQVLSQYAATSPEDWRFELFGEGKPRLLAGQADLDFNLSHSGDLLVCAITGGHPVGVDIEFEKPARDVMRLARRFFSEAEVTALEACDIADQRSRFYDLWTLKEATVKAQGEAIAPLLKTLNFRLNYRLDGTASIASLFEHPDMGCALFKPAPSYHLALSWPISVGKQPIIRVIHWRGPEDSQEAQLPLRGASWL